MLFLTCEPGKVKATASDIADESGFPLPEKKGHVLKCFGCKGCIVLNSSNTKYNPGSLVSITDNA